MEKSKVNYLPSTFSVVQLCKNIFHLCTRYKLDIFDFFVLYTDEENISLATSAKGFLSLSPIEQNENPRAMLTRVKHQESRE